MPALLCPMTTLLCCWSTIGLYSNQEITLYKWSSLGRVKYVSGTAFRCPSWFSAILLIIGAHGIAWQAWRIIIPAKFVRMTSDQYICLWQNRQNKHAHKSLREGWGTLQHVGDLICVLWRGALRWGSSRLSTPHSCAAPLLWPPEREEQEETLRGSREDCWALCEEAAASTRPAFPGQTLSFSCYWCCQTEASDWKADLRVTLRGTLRCHCLLIATSLFHFLPAVCQRLKGFWDAETTSNVSLAPFNTRIALSAAHCMQAMERQQKFN